MATHSSTLAWRIPGTGEPGGLPSMGSHRVRHDRSNLAAAAVSGFSRVWLFATLWTVAHQAFLFMGILQARILEWVAMPSSRGASQSRN